MESLENVRIESKISAENAGIEACLKTFLNEISRGVPQKKESQRISLMNFCRNRWLNFWKKSLQNVMWEFLKKFQQKSNA